MKEFVTINGLDAVALSGAINRLPEIRDAGFWYQGTLWAARGLAGQEPERVRLYGSARLFAESLLMTSFDRTSPAELSEAITAEFNRIPRTDYLAKMVGIVLKAMDR